MRHTVPHERAPQDHQRRRPRGRAGPRVADVAAREVPGEGPAGRAQAVGRRSSTSPGAKYDDDRGPRRRVGRRLDLRGPAHLRAEEVRRHPAQTATPGGDVIEVRPHDHDDDRGHLRRHAPRLLRPRRRASRTSSSTGSTARCRSRRSRASAARRSTRPTTRSSGSPACRRTTTGWSRSGASRRAA